MIVNLLVVLLFKLKVKFCIVLKLVVVIVDMLVLSFKFFGMFFEERVIDIGVLLMLIMEMEMFLFICKEEIIIGGMVLFYFY